MGTTNNKSKLFATMKYMENERLEAVHSFLELDYDKSTEFQEIVDLAAELCQKPVAMITLLDKEVNWTKVTSGMEVKIMPRETSFCQYTITKDELFIVNDATKDHRFDNNALVHDEPNVRFYAGAPLIIKNGLRLGSLCLFDGKPNKISSLQQKTLTVLSRQVVFLMELELSYQLLRKYVEKIETSYESLRKIAHIQSHDIRQPLTSIMGLINTIKEDDYVIDKERLLMIEEAAQALDDKIHEIVFETRNKN